MKLRQLCGLALAATLGLGVSPAVAASPAPMPVAGPAAGPVAGPAAGPAGLTDGVLNSKSLTIGVDGAMFDVWDGLDLPVFESLRAQGTASTFNLYGKPMAPTVSGPGWTTIATGAWPDKHGVVDNSFAGSRFDAYPDYLARIEAALPQASTLVVGTWGPVPEQIFTGADLRLAPGDDEATTAAAADHLANGDPDATFVHLDEVDGAGHSCGHDCAAYAEQLTEVDAQIGELLEAVRSRPTFAQEEWLVTITADHGHTAAGGHGGSTPQERSDFVLTVGPGVAAGDLRHDLKIVDIAPTMIAHAGIDVDEDWGLDGQPFADVDPDDFDALRPLLQAQVDETRPGPDTLGWTHQTPDGWTIDNSAMPTGGSTELRGWTFVTDEFWTNVELEQKRETSVRHRDVFAVADSDEWDDLPHEPGRFDSTLVSPAYPIEGTGEVRVSYVTNYQWDGPQTGDVYAVWDGGEPQLVKSYGDSAAANTNAAERLDLTAPAGATSLQLRFRYQGSNSYFWTIDQVEVRQMPASQLRVADIEATATNLDAPDPANPWRIDAEVLVTRPDGTPVDGATVRARFRYGGFVVEREQLTGGDGIAHLRGYVQHADQAVFEVRDVVKDDLVYFGELDALSQLTLDRPLESTLTSAEPSVGGRAKVGAVLTALPGAWGPAPVRLAYQWFADGAPIAGATAETLRLAKPQRRARITVEVTGTKPGYVPATRMSAPTPPVR